jgi:SOS-response transcriptional repressor LexA
MTDLSARASSVLLFIHEYKSRHDYSPSNRDITDACHLNTTSLTKHYCDLLKKDGLVDWLKVKKGSASRTIHLTEKGKQYIADHAFLVNNHEIAEKPFAVRARV